MRERAYGRDRGLAQRRLSNGERRWQCEELASRTADQERQLRVQRSAAYAEEHGFGEVSLLVSLRQVSNLLRAGVHQDVAMSISGHLDPKVFSRYNIVNEEDLAEAGRKLVAYAEDYFGSITNGITKTSTAPAVQCK
jgi:hypothetical protein